LLKGINWGLVVITLITYLIPFIPPHWSQPILFVGLFYPWLFLFNLIFILYWATDRSRFLLVPLFVLVLGYAPMTKIIGFNFSGAQEESEFDLSIASYNIHYFKDYYQNNKLLSRDALVKMISEVDADVLCVQEFPRELGSPMEISKKILTHSSFDYYNHLDNSDLVIFSRYPLEVKGGLLFSNKVNGYQVVEVRMPNRQKIKVINTHLASNEVSVIAEKIASEPEMKEEERLKSIFGMLGQYGKSAKARVQQIEKILMEVGNDPNGTIVAGDFNEIPQSYIYRQISKKLKDTFVEGGKGLGFSYNGKIPGLRIDYIFCSADIGVDYCNIVPSDFSDHKMIIAKLTL
jgi:endonuclease/exonuclease/phosphatase family metal-dependent hydrolase